MYWTAYLVVTAQQDRHDAEVNQLRETIADLESQCMKFQRGTPVGEGRWAELINFVIIRISHFNLFLVFSDSRFIEGQDGSDHDLADGDLSHGDLSTRPADLALPKGSSEDLNSSAVSGMSVQEKYEEQIKELNGEILA